MFLLLSSKKLLSHNRSIITRYMSQDTKSSILNWASKDGEFRRQQSVFRDFIEDKPDAKFAPEP
jgi:putative glutathione S-transferase